MKKDKMELVVILDCSSSMGCIKSSIIEGYNTLINAQKKLSGECNVTFTTFSSDYKVQYISKPISEVSELNEDTYVVGGMTALNDAVGETMRAVGQRFADMDESERPEKVMVAILTDGEENVSKEYKTAQIKEMVEHQKEKYSWEFLYIGTDDINVKENASSYGILDALGYSRDASGVDTMTATLNARVTSYRTGK